MSSMRFHWWDQILVRLFFRQITLDRCPLKLWGYWIFANNIPELTSCYII